MAIFSKHEIISGDSILIPEIAQAIKEGFQVDGYEVSSDSLISGGYDISITKGNIFKAVLGMKTALKVTLIPHSNGIIFDANVGIFGQQAIPTVISMFFFWPVLISQIWGLVEQAKLDDKAITICKNTILKNAFSSKLMDREINQPKSIFCTQCGASIKPNSKFCPECGSKINI